MIDIMNSYHIKSFVRREGRITPRQRMALDSTEYLLPTEGLVSWPTVFGNHAPTFLEIGFGMGQALLAMASRFPERNFVGIEVYRPGAGALLAELKTLKLQNVRVFLQDAARVLPDCIPDNSLQGIQIFFPDPWPKTRHHKRRLIQLPFVRLLMQKLAIRGRIHLATDWEEYALHMRQILAQVPELTDIATHPGDRGDRPMTKYELRGTRLGHGIWDLIFAKEKGF